MKIRLGFVSNSSSSSFIISYNADSKLLFGTGKLQFGIPFDTFLDAIGSFNSYSSESTELNARNKPGVLHELEEMCDFDKNDEIRKLIEDIKDMRDSEIVSKIQISYHDKFFIDMFRAYITSGGVKVIWKSEDLW